MKEFDLPILCVHQSRGESQSYLNGITAREPISQIHKFNNNFYNLVEPMRLRLNLLLKYSAVFEYFVYPLSLCLAEYLQRLNSKGDFTVHLCWYFQSSC